MSRIEWVIVTLLVVGWIPGVLAMAKVWSEVDYASHGYLVPFVALWAATAHWETLKKLPAEPVRGGLLLLGLLAPVTVAAVLFGNATLIGILAVLTVGLTVMALRGTEWVKTLRFPLFYLVFMIPLPLAWVNPVIVQLQLWVSGVAVQVLQLADVAIFRDGNVLNLPGGVTLFVAEACSGITSLITLLPIGVFIAYFTDSVPWRRVALVLAVIPIALAGNLLRVILSVLLTLSVDVEFATEGPLHEWAGVGTYVLGCLCLIGVGHLLRRFGPGDSAVVSHPSDSAAT